MPSTASGAAEGQGGPWLQEQASQSLDLTQALGGGAARRPLAVSGIVWDSGVELTHGPWGHWCFGTAALLQRVGLLALFRFSSSLQETPPNNPYV